MGAHSARCLKGFTLIELMVAMTILGLSLTLVLEVISAGTSLGHEIHRRTEAILLARWKVNQLQIEGFPALGSREGTFEEPFDGYRWATEVNPTDDDNLRELRLAIKWREGWAEKEIEMSTLLYNYGERRKGLFY
ncbi:MAG: hypothetical protein A2Z06_01800 [Candidatus Glassbacteria bacterium RBG_16_58_8]|uniref:Type II secretion system protein GspI n=1 Tax=Candidatus Glassbacteria bacterium RBG_16_58_8 TaxID=1817866 RepID=A0A1F5YD12_9BACT|nr:MAG: hypothetical protein A2Z06_01800 [Candidatus Glassbacteria bacterium RBG_16_58_8]